MVSFPITFISSFPLLPSLGLDPKLLTKVINMASGRCWSSEVYNPCPGVMENVPSNNNYEGGFGTALMTKVTQGGVIGMAWGGAHLPPHTLPHCRI